MRTNKTLIIVIFFLSFIVISGCQLPKPTYTKEKILESIISVCKNEYNIEPKVWLIGETVWVYTPMPNLIKNEITKDLEFDKEILEKISKVIMAVSRVVLSMRPRPQFIAVVASDTEVYGIDYTIITWITDIVKFQLQAISRNEFYRRNVTKIEENANALFDTEGNHIEKKEINMGDFLARQIAQRIYSKFGLEPPFKDYLKVERVDSVFEEDVFGINANIKQLETLPQSSIDIHKEIIKIIAYVIREYDFKNFLLVEVTDSVTNEKTIFSRAALMEFR